MKRAAHIFIAVAVAAIFAASVQSCIDRRKDFAQYPMNVDGDVRVLLADGKRFTVSVAGPHQILSGGNVLFRDERPMPKVNVGPAPNGIALGTKTLAYPRLEIVPRVDGSLLVSGKAYRGRLLLIRRKKGLDDKGLDDKGLAAVNVLPLDDYLAGVISGEMPAHWPMPALRAQAVAARTYALYRQRKRTKWNYDVTAGTGDQVYKGVAGETASARRAVDQTRGVVLLYNWKFLPAYYHSVCGGHTAARKNVFDEADITPLAGVRCGYCNPKRHGMRSSKFYRWQFSVSQSKLLEALAAKGHKLKKITAIRPAKPGPGGHMARLTILPAAGKPFELSVHELRSMIGYGKIISNSFECSTRGGTLAFGGKGFGHGVGMCQWGAKGMADSGYGFDQILQYYYPGAEMRRVY